MRMARFERARVSPADLESAALDRSATCAFTDICSLELSYEPPHLSQGFNEYLIDKLSFVKRKWRRAGLAEI